MDMTVTEDIIYVGVNDHDVDLFEGQYVVPQGMAYNSYFIKDSKTAVMDTVDARFGDEWLKNIEAASGGRMPDYLVIHHMEPDHSACIAKALSVWTDTTVVSSAQAFKFMEQFFGATVAPKRLVVKEGDVLDLGRHKLTFVAAPMVHWPEVMVSYESHEKVLFSADAFGKFGALSHDEAWECEARRYYFNICGKYGSPVESLLKKAEGLDIATICPLHGPILRENLGHYLHLYKTWSSYQAEEKGVLVAYASIHGGTAVVAHRVAEMLRQRGVGRVAITDLCRDDMAEAVEDAFRVDHLVVAAASYDGDLFPPMHDFLHHLKLKQYQKRRVAIIENGSWAPSAGRVMQGMLSQMKEVEIVAPMVTIRSRMKASDEPQLEALVEALFA
jgi:flavorubredoxin